MRHSSNSYLSITYLTVLIASTCSTGATSPANYLAERLAERLHGHNTDRQSHDTQSTGASATTNSQQGSPSIIPFAFNLNVQENQRLSVLCTISAGEVPVTISWLKDGQLLTPALAHSKKIIIKPDGDQSTLKFGSVRLEHAGNYTCIVKNNAGLQTHSSQLIVHGEPRWLRQPLHEPIVATRGQTIVIDCPTTGWPKPQQSWQIKTLSQTEFEPLAATGRISLAANGSLVIRNADKSDEANYRCKSFNGIGRGLDWSAALKVTVPAHFEANKRNNNNIGHGAQPTALTSVVRKQNQVQLRCDAFGDEPIMVEWLKNKQPLNQSELEPRYLIQNKPLVNGLISMLLIKQAQREDNSLYECVARNHAGRDRLPIELIVHEEPDNIQGLQATQINSRSITLMWSEPYDGRSPITNYMFQYKKVQPELSAAASQAAAELELMLDSAASSGDSSAAVLAAHSGGSATKSSADDWQQAQRIVLPAAGLQAGYNGSTVTSAEGLQFTIDKLDPSSKYVLRALAVNAIGQSRFSQPMEFTTDEEAPELGPTNIRASAINSTSIKVSWDEIPRSRQFGRIHGYYVGHRIVPNNNSLNSSVQNFVYKPYTINDLLLQQQQLQLQQQQQQSQQQSQQHNQQQQQHQQPHVRISTTGQLHQHAMGQAAGLALQDNAIQFVAQNRLETTLHDLRRDTTYEITVVAFNSRGSSPSSDSVFTKTIEMEPPHAVRMIARRESNDSILFELQRDANDPNPVDDYSVYQERNSASQEWLQVRLPGNQTHYKAPGLKCGHRYQFYIVANNKVGKSQPSEVVSGTTTGALPKVPAKTSLIKWLNDTCLMINLNSFDDTDCRVKTFNVRYRVDKPTAGGASSAPVALAASSGLMNAQGQIASHQALSAASAMSNSKQSATGSVEASIGHQSAQATAAVAGSAAGGDDWITVRPKAGSYGQRAIMGDEDHIEYLCGLNPEGQYSIHVAAMNDVGRSEIQYTVLMSSDELRHSMVRELADMVVGLPNLFSIIPSIIVFLLAGLFLSLVSLILYTTVMKYYQKFVIMHNQIRATRRAKRDERRRRKLNNARHSQKIDLWADEYDDEDDEDDLDDDDEDDHNNVNGNGGDMDDMEDHLNSHDDAMIRIDHRINHNKARHGRGNQHQQLHTRISSDLNNNSEIHIDGSGDYQRQRGRAEERFARQFNTVGRARSAKRRSRTGRSMQELDEFEISHDDGDDEGSASGRSATNVLRANARNMARARQQNTSGHYLSNLANSAFDTSSIDSRPACGGKYASGNSASCVSSASTDSMHGRFQCLNSKQYVKMNEYTMLPTISASLAPVSDIYGTTGSSSAGSLSTNLSANQQQQQQQAQPIYGTNSSPATNSSNSLYYSTLRRTSMQTYLPNNQTTTTVNRQQQQQVQQQQRLVQAQSRGNHAADIYGYYLAPGQAQASGAPASTGAQVAADEVANSIFVPPPHQIIYSAPNIRHQPVFL